VDLNEELHPIGYYINDREEMINQMFSVIKGNKLRAMLPPILKVTTVILNLHRETNVHKVIGRIKICVPEFHMFVENEEFVQIWV
jgi:hypothetical protein